MLEVGTVNGCSPPPCYAAFASGDGGRTWAYLPSRGLVAGQLVVPAAALAVGRFFAFGPGGLQVTNDGGASFTTIAPRLPGFAGPAVAGGRDEVVVSNVAAEGYGDSAAPTLLYRLRPGQHAQGAALYLPDRQEALQPVGDSSDISGRVHVVSCQSQCSDLAGLPWAGPTTLLRSPAYTSDQVIVAVSGLRDVAVSSDGGHSFVAGHVAGDLSIHSLAIVPRASGARLVVLADADGGVNTMVSDDLGGTWEAVASAQQTPFFRPKVLRWLTGSRLIEAGDEGSPAIATTFRCSDDGGTTWGAC